MCMGGRHKGDSTRTRRDELTNGAEEVGTRASERDFDRFGGPTRVRSLGHLAFESAQKTTTTRTTDYEQKQRRQDILAGKVKILASP